MKQVNTFLYAIWALITTLAGQLIVLLFDAPQFALALEYQVYVGLVLVGLFILFP